MFNETGEESAGSPEKILDGCKKSINLIINEMTQKIEGLESEAELRNKQVREYIVEIIKSALTENDPETIKSILIDASDYAYQQAGIPGFEDLDGVSDRIDEATKSLG